MEASDVLNRYCPNLSPARWAEMQQAVLERVAARHSTAPYTTADAMSLALTHLVGFFDWQLTEGAWLFTMRSDVIDYYTRFRATEVKANVAERERKVLRDIAGLPRTVERRKHSTTSPAEPPYTDADIARIHAWAAFQRDESRRRNTASLATLSLGAGLTASEVATARVRDIHVDTDAVRINVNGRTVPVSIDWAESASHLATIDAAHEFLLAPRATTRTAQLVQDARRRTIGDLVPYTQRMRNTWFVAQVNAGVPAETALAWAGLTTSSTLRRLKKYVNRPGTSNEYAS